MSGGVLRQVDFLMTGVQHIFIRYSGLPLLSPECDNEACRRGGAYSLEVTYCFPQWFLARAIYLVAAKTCMGDPVFGLTVQRRVENTRELSILKFARVGDNKGIRILLDKREAFPNDIEVNHGDT